MILRIAQLGQPILRRVAEPVAPQDIGASDFQQFLDDLASTMEHYRGVGLAAPQVFVSRRVFVAAILPATAENESRIPEWFINPRIVDPRPDRVSDWEGCLSFRELSVLVPRWPAVTIEYLDRTGALRSRHLEGFPARVAQHEFDHLEGILTIDRAASTRDIVKASELDAHLGDAKLTAHCSAAE